MNRRSTSALFWQTMVAAAAGGGLALLMHDIRLDHPWVTLGLHCAGVGLHLFICWTQALAVPVIFSSVILGTVGLEPMRALGKITRRTLGWMLLTGLLAALTGLATVSLVPVPNSGWGSPPLMRASGDLDAIYRGAFPESGWWVGGVLLALGFAFYRNEVTEVHGRLLTRLFLGIERMVTPMLDWTRRFVPVAVFTGVLLGGVHVKRGHFLMNPPTDIVPYVCECLLIGWLAFVGLVLPGVFWVFTRINPWRYFFEVAPAAAAAFATGSLESALPLTFDAVHNRTHVSNRVAGPVLSLCAVLQREGMALACVVYLACRWRASGESNIGGFAGLAVCTGVVWSIGSRLGSSGLGGVPGFLLLGIGLPTREFFYFAVLGQFMQMGGAAVSVLSHACAAAIIARREGEYWVPGPPPSSEELEGLKNELRLAEE